MKLRAKYLGIETGNRPFVTLSKDDAYELGALGGDRLRISAGGKSMTAIADIVTKSVSKGSLGMSDEVWSRLKISQGSAVEVELAGPPEGLSCIREKLRGRKMTYEDIYKIVKDAVDGNLSETEIASFVTALHMQGGPSMDEVYSLSLSMVETGKQLGLKRKPIVDKHSVGGVPGDKTTLLVVPVISSLGFTIPKTSSRAITSAAGTADRAETLMPVDIDIEEMKRVVEKTNGCIVWGGAISLAPADDIFIRAEFPLSIDPLLLPSIMSKKKAVGAQYLVVDIPTGKGTKMKSPSESDHLGKEFIDLGRKMGIQTQCVVTYGDQPVGQAIGAGLEAKEALSIICNKTSVPDVIDKVSHIAGTLLEMVGVKNGVRATLEAIKSGKAEKKLREIIYQQGGDSEIRPEDIETGKYGYEVRSEEDGVVLSIDNASLVAIARAAGSPKDKKAGLVLSKKIGDKVKKGDILYTVYSDKTTKLADAQKIADGNGVFQVANRTEMMIHRLREAPKPSGKPTFILER
jgi:AMP phosphorylase